MMRKLVSIFMLMLCSNFCFANAEEAKQCEFNGISYRQAVAFTNGFKQAILKNNKAEVANLMWYPVRVNLPNSKSYLISNKAMLIERYNVLFNAKAKKALANDKSIFCNYQGGMIGGGVVWFNMQGNIIKVFAINQMR